MPSNFNNLDDVQKYVQEHMKEWDFDRGQKTFMSKADITPAEGYEVLQLFSPGEPRVPFAEFWQGYYDFSPDTYTGFYGINTFGADCRGSLRFAMDAAKQEYDRLCMCPKIIKAVQRAVEMDETLKSMYRPISEKHIKPISGTYPKSYAVDCSHFHFDYGNKKRCVMSVKEVKDKDNCFIVTYSLQTWVNKHYEEDKSQDMQVKIAE